MAAAGLCWQRPAGVDPLILAGAPVGVILATALCVNLRFVVFSAHATIHDAPAAA